MLGATIIGSVLAYAALNLYLFTKIMPLPITLIPQRADLRSKTRERIPA